MATLANLIQRLRLDLDDQVEPFFWSNDQLTKYVNQAEYEACLRTELLRDSSTSAVCQIAVTAGQNTYALHSKILVIKRAWLDGEAHDLIKTGQHELDREDHYWRSKTGTPEYFFADRDTRKLVLFPNPDTTYTLKLTVWRTPMAEMAYANASTVTPEVPEEHHFNLLDYALWLAYRVHDSDVFNPNRAQEHLALFNGHFGDRPSAWDMEHRRTRRTNRVQAQFM